MAKSYVFATLTLSQVGVILTSVVCAAALGVSLYYNKQISDEKRACAAELADQKRSYENRIAQSERDHKRELAASALTLNAASNTLAAAQKELSAGALKLAECEDLIAELRRSVAHEKEWTHTLSNQALNAIAKLKSKHSSLRLENESLSQAATTAHLRAERMSNIAVNKQRQYKNAKAAQYCPRCDGSGYIPGKPVTRNIFGRIETKPGSPVKCPACSPYGKL